MRPAEPTSPPPPQRGGLRVSVMLAAAPEGVSRDSQKVNGVGVGGGGGVKGPPSSLRGNAARPGLPRFRSCQSPISWPGSRPPTPEATRRPFTNPFSASVCRALKWELPCCLLAFLGSGEEGSTRSRT